MEIGCIFGTRDHPPPNVVLLASVEDQKRADERIPHLLKIPAAVRGLSCEPLLEDVDLRHGIYHGECGSPHCVKGKVDWVIAGGESGKRARPCNIEWLRSLRDQCHAAGVAFFCKQLGSNAWMPQDEGGAKSRGLELTPLKLKHPAGADPAEWPSDLRVQEFPYIGT